MFNTMVLILSINNSSFVLYIAQYWRVDNPFSKVILTSTPVSSTQNDLGRRKTNKKKEKTERKRERKCEREEKREREREKLIL